MKVLVVLVLAVFTGCNASHLYADRPPKPKLEVVLEFLLDYGLIFHKAAGKTYHNFRRTEFGRSVMEYIDERAHVAGEIVDHFMQILPREVKHTMLPVANMSYRLASNVGEYLVKNHLEPMAESVAPVMEKAVGELFLKSKVVQDLVSPYFTELMDKVDPIFQDIQARLQAFHQSVVKTE